jgi:hypothetical protein
VAYHFQTKYESGSTQMNVDAEGRFEFRLQLDVPSTLIATDTDGRWAEAVQRDVAPGTHDVVLQLSESMRAKVRVQGSTDEPVRSAVISALTGDGGSFQIHELACTELEPGLYECRAPGMQFGLMVEAPGYLTSSRYRLEPQQLPAEISFRLDAAPLLRGRVLANGKPVAGASIEAKPVAAAGSQLSFNGFRCLMEPSSQTRTTSAADGSFALSLESKQAVYLRATSAGFAAALGGPIGPEGREQEIVLELTLGGAIEGRVRAKDGSTLAGSIVGVTNGDGHPRTMRSGHDGLFRFEGLTPGDWLVLACEAEYRTDVSSVSASLGDGRIDWSCEVQAVRTTFFDLQLEQ